jgi:thiazole synthase
VSEQDTWTLAGRTWTSRLIIGTGKFKDAAETQAALAASGAEIVTVALRRVDLKAKDNLLSWIDRDRYCLLPNTAGCYTADEAVRTCRLARELGLSDLVKLEVIGDPHNLFPDNEATLAAAKILVAEGFTVLPYCIDDPIVCKKLEDLGCAAVMPLAAPIGSGLGIRNPLQPDDHPRAGQGAGDRRRRGGHRERRGLRDGARLRRRVDEHRHRRREGPDPHGRGHARRP